MSLLDKFRENIKQFDLFTPEDGLLLAVSGGVDSVVLCELCKEAGYEFMIAHCNYQLRGEESERDEQFVRKLGAEYKVEVHVKRFDTTDYAADHRLSIQEAARDLRYEWFFDLWQKKIKDSDKPGPTSENAIPPARRLFVLTAHHADDNIETVLMNFFRGTGLHGLTGIPAGLTKKYSVQSSHLRRPLLPFFKNELVEYARLKGLHYVEDSSNLSSKYTRNFFRNEIIPAITKVYPQVKENLLDNIRRFNEIGKLYDFSVREIKKKLCKKREDEIHIPIKQLLGYSSKALVYEIINEYGFSEKQVEEVLKLAAGDSGSYIDAAGDHYRIIKHRHWFIIASSISPLAENVIIEKAASTIHFPGGKLQIEETNDIQPVTGNDTACLDATLISFPLLLRKWKTGDYFYPLGMKKKKKLSRFFIDQKLSKTAKEKAWVIEMNRKIVWVVGHRIDDRVKITGATTKVLKINLHA